MKAHTPRFWSLVPFALLVGCRSAEPTPPGAFDSSGGLVTIVCLGDGFVRCDGERVPLEACVLRLRQRTRSMGQEQLQRFVVQLQRDPAAASEPLLGPALDGQLNRLIEELDIMDVGQAKLL
ncbi:MAG: hypothetical protein ACKVQR_08600 [Aquabacterium sp.]